MIISVFLTIVKTLLTTVLGVLPNLPAMPAPIITGGQYVMTMISSGVGFVKYLYGTALFNAVISLLVLLIAFDQIWNLVFFIIRKIPVLGIKE